VDIMDSPDTETIAKRVSEDPAHAFLPYPASPVAHAKAGPLTGLTFAVKDLFDVAGYPTGGGNPLVLARSGIKQQTAPAIQALLDSGARFVGKTVTDELAFSMNGKNPHFGTPRNGVVPERIPGGSSSGSAAAVSNGLCDFAIGSDTGGSVRAPGNHCGLFGIRSTHGRVSLERAIPLAPSFDTLGFFAREAEVFARVGAVVLGDDPPGMTVAVAPQLLRPVDLWELIAPEVAAALAPAVKRIESLFGPTRAITVVVDGLDTMYWHFRRVQGFEAWQAHGDFIERYAPPLGPGVAERFAWSKTVTAAQWSTGKAFCDRYRSHLAQLLGTGSILVLPTMPDVAPLLAADETELESYRNAAIRLLCIAVLSGFPQVTLPLAARLGAPLGISLLGPVGSDRALIALAKRVADGH
jgi:amidase